MSKLCTQHDYTTQAHWKTRVTFLQNLLLHCFFISHFQWVMLKVCCGTVPGKLPNKFTMSKKTKTKKKHTWSW